MTGWSAIKVLSTTGRAVTSSLHFRNFHLQIVFLCSYLVDAEVCCFTVYLSHITTQLLLVLEGLFLHSSPPVALAVQPTLFSIWAKCCVQQNIDFLPHLHVPGSGGLNQTGLWKLGFLPHKAADDLLHVHNSLHDIEEIEFYSVSPSSTCR